MNHTAIVIADQKGGVANTTVLNPAVGMGRVRYLVLMVVNYPQAGCTVNLIADNPEKLTYCLTDLMNRVMGELVASGESIAQHPVGFDTEISRSVRVMESRGSGNSLFVFDPGGKVTITHDSLTKEVMKLDVQRQKAKFTFVQ